MPDWLENALSLLALALAAATPTVAALRVLATKLREVALLTEWKGDDEAIARAEIWLTKIAYVLDIVSAYLPHIVISGKQKGWTLPQKASPSSPESSPAPSGPGSASSSGSQTDPPLSS